MLTLRPYQIDAGAATVLSLDKYDRVCLVLATGLGKTVVFSQIANDWTDGRVLVIAHREELIHQAAKKLYEVTGEWPDIEMADQWANELSSRRKRFVVASVQSLHSGRLTGDRFRDFGLVVVDEGHHAHEESSSYGKVLNHLWDKNTGVKVLLVTATPNRHDGKKLLTDHFSYVYTIREGVEDGYLTRPMSSIVVVESMDFSNIKDGRFDLNQTQLHEELEKERPLQEIVTATVEEAGDRKTLIFAASVAAAERMAEITNRLRPDSAAWISGNRNKFPSEVRKEIFRQFAEGSIQFLYNVGVATEGFDDPGIEMIAMARPTKSLSLYAQQIGRGTRVLPGVIDGLNTREERLAAIAASRKPYLKVLDFVDNSRRPLITACDPRILGGVYEPLDEFEQAALARAKLAVEKNTKRGEVSDIDRELLIARQAEREEREQREIREREKIVGTVRYKTTVVDPLNDGEVGKPVRRRPAGMPPTAEQEKFLCYHGFNPNRYNRRSAGFMIGKIKMGEIASKRDQVVARNELPVEAYGSPARVVNTSVATNREFDF